MFNDISSLEGSGFPMINKDLFPNMEALGLGEVVTFRCHSHPTTANWTFCGAGDLTGFIITDGGLSPKAVC